MIFYCGVNDQKWNKHDVNCGRYACVSPVYGKTLKTKTKNRVKLPQKTTVIQDSGAFCDGIGDRLSFEDALLRQEEHARSFNYAGQVSHVASYDLLIDEMWDDLGKRYKKRWSEEDADMAVCETVDAAAFLDSRREDRYLRGKGLILSAQGVTPDQYVDCTKRIVKYIKKGDIFGLGGWCINGRMPSKMMPVFSRTMKLVLPLLAMRQVERVHIWGVASSEFIGPLMWECENLGLIVSTDTAGAQLRPCMGEWGYSGWRMSNYTRASVGTRGIHRAIHVCQTRQWMASGIRKTKYYKPLTETRTRGNQLGLF